VVVKTNCDYQIVASFAVQDETTLSIIEALNILKKWNPDWTPHMFMSDTCEEEITALEDVFEGNMRFTFHIQY